MAANTMIRRGLPILLALAGVTLLIYGAAFSQHKVFFDEEIKTPPEPEQPLPPFMNSRPGGARPPS